MPVTLSKAAIITQPGSTINNKKGGWRSLKPIKDNSKCTKCHICWLTCPDNAIGEDLSINYDYCKGCGICSRQCPLKCITMEKEKK